MSKHIETLREYFAQPPSKTVWKNIVDTLDTWHQNEPETLLELAFPYCKEHLSKWPAKNNLKPHPKHWLQAAEEGDISILPLLELALITHDDRKHNYYTIVFGEALFKGQSGSFDGAVRRTYYATSDRGNVLEKLCAVQIQTQKYRQNRYLRYFPGTDYMNECHSTHDIIGLWFRDKQVLEIPMVPDIIFSQPTISPHTFTIQPKTLFGFQNPEAIEMDILQENTLIDTVPLGKLSTHKALRPFDKNILSTREWEQSTTVSFNTLERELPQIYIPFPFPDGDRERYVHPEHYMHEQEFMTRSLQQKEQQDAAKKLRKKRRKLLKHKKY